jgi:hypothetical protein
VRTLRRVVRAYDTRRWAGRLSARARLCAEASATLSRAGADAVEALEESIGHATEQVYTFFEEEAGRDEIVAEAASVLHDQRTAVHLELEHRGRQCHAAVEAFERAVLLGTA